MSLEELYDQLRYKEAELSRHETNRRNYLNKANECEKLYNQVIADKEIVEGYRKSVKKLRNERFDDFIGYQHRNVYKETMIDLIESYDTLIDDIDTNADRLNKKRMEWENKAYALDGPIGTLRSAINYLKTTIQNWVN